MVPWSVDKLTSLRLGRRLVAEVAASRSGRRAFVDIQPIKTGADRDAGQEGWARSDRDRTFRLTHREYDADQVDGFDYDIGAVLVRAATAGGEAELAAALAAWDLEPQQFGHPWETGDPR